MWWLPSSGNWMPALRGPEVQRLSVTFGFLKPGLNPLALGLTLGRCHSLHFWITAMANLYFKRNLPVWERGLRLLAAGLLGALGLGLGGLFSGWLGWLMVASAASLGLTAFVGFCPACAMLGRRSLGPRS